MDNCYLTANDHERYLDSLARSKAMCADKLRHGYCLREQCDSCERKKLWDACEAELAPYSKLLLKDKIDVEIHRIAVANPTLEELEDARNIEREARRKAIVQAQKDLDWEWWHSGGWIGVLAIILVPIIVPLILTSEWFL